MKQQHADYQVVPYPKMRRLEAIAYRSVQHKPMIHGLLEVDVTRARAFLREYKAKTGESLSFTAFLIACLAKAVEEHKAVQAYRKGSKRLILFKDVDVYTPIERNVAGQKQLMPYIIRAANHKTFREIHQEIRAAQVQDMSKSLGGVQSHPLALAAVAPSLSGDGVDRGKVSPGVEEISGNGGHHSSGDVWERCRMGNSSPLSFPLGDGGRHWREAGCRGRAYRHP